MHIYKQNLLFVLLTKLGRPTSSILSVQYKRMLMLTFFLPKASHFSQLGSVFSGCYLSPSIDITSETGKTKNCFKEISSFLALTLVS